MIATPVASLAVAQRARSRASGTLAAALVELVLVPIWASVVLVVVIASACALDGCI